MSSWEDFAACKDEPQYLWFSDDKRDQAIAKSVCAGCPVQEPCREAGKGEHHGVWAGVDRGEKERKRASRAAVRSRQRQVA